MNTYRLHWFGDEKAQEIHGETPVDAFNKAGIDHGALPALDYYESEIECSRCHRAGFWDSRDKASGYIICDECSKIVEAQNETE